MPCPHLVDGLCQVAIPLVNVSAEKIKAVDSVCKRCQADPQPQTLNHATVSLAASYLIREGKRNEASELLKLYPFQHPDSEKSPGTVKRLWIYAQAVSAWIAAGRPERTQEQVESVLKICGECEHFTTRYGLGRCLKCGCNVSKGPALVNKARMATESCPVGKW